MKPWPILQLIEWTSDYFAKNGIPNPRLDAELLLSHILKKKRIDLYLSFEEIVAEKDLAAFKGCIQRRIKREPLQYITGTQEFWGIPIKVTPDVLIPRPETEILVEKTLEEIRKTPADSACGAPAVLDVCTGSGAIIAALAGELPDAQFIGTDISAAALEIAKENTNAWRERIRLLHGNLFEPLQSRADILFDAVTCNPPYVSEAEFPELQPEIRDYEPKQALIAGDGGLAIIREVINTVRGFLKPGGFLAMEIGDGQANAVKATISSSVGCIEPEIVKDYGGVERIVIARWTN